MKTIKLNFVTSVMLVLGMVFSIFVISCSNDEMLNNNENFNEDVRYLQKVRIKFMIGLNANLEKPRNDCKSGWGVCEITIGIVNIGIEKKVNMGVSNDNYLHFQIDEIDVEESSMKIEDGDEYITFGHEVIEYFRNEDLDISNIKLVKGEYEVNYDSSSDKYVVKIPFTRL